MANQIAVEQQQSRLKELIAKGKEQGFLTYAEVNDHLPDEISDPEQNIEWAILVEGTNTNITETTSRNHLSDYLDTVIINKTKVIFEQYRFMYGNLRSNDDVIA